MEAEILEEFISADKACVSKATPDEMVEMVENRIIINTISSLYLLV